jgi:hypothetical protein
MELAKIERILEAYFEGESTLEQEASLKEYFTGNEVAPHLAVYKTLFVGLKAAKEEVSEREISLPPTSSSTKRWWYSIAASILIVIGVSSLLMPGDQITQEEQEALAAFNKSKETLILLSKNFNKGTEELAVLGQFTEAKNYILK